MPRLWIRSKVLPRVVYEVIGYDPASGMMNMRGPDGRLFLQCLEPMDSLKRGYDRLTEEPPEFKKEQPDEEDIGNRDRVRGNDLRQRARKVL